MSLLLFLYFDNRAMELSDYVLSQSEPGCFIVENSQEEESEFLANQADLMKRLSMLNDVKTDQWEDQYVSNMKCFCYDS